MGKLHCNPILDSRIYKVHLEDGRIGVIKNSCSNKRYQELYNKVLRLKL